MFTEETSTVSFKFRFFFVKVLSNRTIERDSYFRCTGVQQPCSNMTMAEWLQKKCHTMCWAFMNAESIKKWSDKWLRKATRCLTLESFTFHNIIGKGTKVLTKFTTYQIITINDPITERDNRNDQFNFTIWVNSTNDVLIDLPRLLLFLSFHTPFVCHFRLCSRSA